MFPTSEEQDQALDAYIHAFIDTHMSVFEVDHVNRRFATRPRRLYCPACFGEDHSGPCPEVGSES